MNQNSENRNYSRHGSSFSVSYSVLGKQKQYKKVKTINISGGGMCLPFKDNIESGTILKIQLELTEEKKKFSLKAKVVWVKSALEDKDYPYRIGLEFVDVDFAEQNILSNVIQYLNRDELLKEFYR